MDGSLVMEPQTSRSRMRPPRVEIKSINLALQGGGAHGAFTWGVLDRFGGWAHRLRGHQRGERRGS